jgi:hypothetical protein
VAPRRAILRALPLALLAALLLVAPARGATVTVGSPLAQAFKSFPFNSVGTVSNTALPAGNVVSPISGAIVRWRISGATGGPFKLRVLRPAGPSLFTGAGTSAAETPSSTATQTFSTSLPIQAGDAIGLDNSNDEDRIGVAEVPGAAFLFWDPPLLEGSTRPGSPGADPLEVAFNAEVQPAPTVASVAPAAGSFKGRTRVTIDGSDFSGATAVSFGSAAATGFSLDSDTRITATTPAAEKPGKVDVVVTTVAGASAPGAAAKFTYTACKVPNVLGKRLKKARKRLRKARCKVGKVSLKKGAERATARVLKQRPKPGSLRAPGAKVRLTVG